MRQATLAALTQVFERDGRVVRLTIDGEECLVPFAVVLFLVTHPYSDRPLPLRSGKPRFMQPVPWDGDAEVVLPRAL
jgi:hypothetical protein